MPSKKGHKKLFDSGVIVAILSGQEGTRTNSGEKINMGDVAEVNEHLFPYSGRCMGLLVGVLATNLSKPEILRQCKKLKGVKVVDVSQDQLKRILGKRVVLTCTGE